MEATRKMPENVNIAGRSVYCVTSLKRESNAGEIFHHSCSPVFTFFYPHTLFRLILYDL